MTNMTDANDQLFNKALNRNLLKYDRNIVAALIRNVNITFVMKSTIQLN